MLFIAAVTDEGTVVVFLGTKLSSASVFETETDLLDHPSVLVAESLSTPRFSSPRATLEVQCTAFIPCVLTTWTWWLGLNHGGLDAELDAVVAETLGFTVTDRDSLAALPDAAMDLPCSQGGRNATLQLP